MNAMKKLTLGILMLVASFAQAQQENIPTLADIARKENGKIFTMNYKNADSYCHNRGERLPTARELALYSQSLGSQLSDTAQNKFQLVNVKDINGNSDPFYINTDGYSSPAEKDLRQNWFWSSSVSPDDDDNDSAYAFIGGTGWITLVHREFDNVGVYCVK